MSGELRPLEAGHLDELVRLREVSFGGRLDEEARGDQRRFLEDGLVWGLLDGDEVLGACRLWTADHWFGGRRVPCQHVSSVVVPPEHRGRGLASAMMRAAVGRGAGQGAGLSLLYPATNPLYRRLGWEQAGAYVRYRLKARAAPPRGTALRRARPEDWPALRACHEESGRALNGPLLHPDHRWEQVRRAQHAYVLDAEAPGAGVDAYLAYDTSRASDEWQYSLDVVDWAATTPRGLEALLGFVGHHGSVGRDAALSGPLPHPWTFLTVEQDVRRDGGVFWMARGLDLPAAVAARGFGPGVSLSVAFAVDDPLVEAARGPWRLDVADGAGTLRPAAAADVVLDARAVGPLYTGFTSPAQLALAGLVSGPVPDLALLATAFAGPVPVLFDFF
jgi:predicted acetyltransferase